MSELFADPNRYIDAIKHEDGGVPVDDRPPINPWRHAYVRTKHFRRAERNLRNQWPVWAHSGSERNMLEAMIGANRAADNADWGCDPSVHVKRPDS